MTKIIGNPEDLLPGGSKQVAELVVRFLLERHNGHAVPVVDKSYLRNIVLNGDHLSWLPQGLYTLTEGSQGADSRLTFSIFDHLTRQEIGELTDRRVSLEQMPTMTVDTLNRLVTVVQELRERGTGTEKWWLKSVAGMLRKAGINNITDFTLKNGYYKSRVFKEAVAFERYRMKTDLMFDTDRMELEIRGRQLLAVAESTVAGMGLFAKRRLQKSLLVTTYSGQVISSEEARRLLSRGNDSLIDLPSLNCAINGHPGKEPFFIGRYMNHASKASKAHNINAELTTYRKLASYVPSGSDNHPLLPPLTDTDLADKSDLTIAFFAKRDIPPGEELFWDYVEGLDPFVSG